MSSRCAGGAGAVAIAGRSCRSLARLPPPRVATGPAGSRPRALHSAPALERAAPEDVGLCSRRLLRFETFLDKQKALSGYVLAVARHGKVCHLSSRGSRDIAAGLPTTEDTIFRMYSLSKLVTSVALLQLLERGLFQLEDPVHAFLPKFKDMKVNRTRDGPVNVDRLERPMTVRHLLTHTSGLTYGIFDTSAVGREYLKLGVKGTASDMELAAFADLVAEVPLKFQPGTGFQYSVSTDIVGRLVEVLSGQTLDAYLAQHVFGPLGMADAGFSLTSRQVGRLAVIYEMGPDGLRPCDQAFNVPTRPFIDRRPSMVSGGSGLLCAATDYLRFALMLAGRGSLGRCRVLARKTVELMRRNHLPQGRDVAALGGRMADFYHCRGLGWGLGAAVVLSPDFGFHCSDGTFFWAGLGSTYLHYDPSEELVVVLMAQFMPVVGAEVWPIRAAIASLASQAIVA